MIIVGLHGKLESGKNTVANFLERDHGFVKIAFAAELKRAIDGIFHTNLMNDDSPEYKNSLFKNGPLTIRELMTRFGDATLAIDPMVWINHVSEFLKTTQSSRVVITDVRYMNEFSFLKNGGGHLCKIVNNGKRISNNPAHKNHKSETNLDNPDVKFDFTITNNNGETTLDQLRSQINTVVHSIKGFNE